MKALFFVILFFITSAIHAQSLKHKNLNCEVLIDINYGGNINVYDSTGKIIKKLKNNLKDSAKDLIYLTIIGKNDSMYNVIASYFIKGRITEGWIKRDTSHIGIYTKTCGSPSTLNLYQEPGKKSKILSTIQGPVPYLHIKDCENNWLFVSVILSKKKYEGWISPDMQCSNPYTTCCGQ